MDRRNETCDVMPCKFQLITTSKVHKSIDHFVHGGAVVLGYAELMQNRAGWTWRVKRSKDIRGIHHGDRWSLMWYRTDNGPARCRRLATYCVSLDYRRRSTDVRLSWPCFRRLQVTPLKLPAIQRRP